MDKFLFKNREEFLVFMLTILMIADPVEKEFFQGQFLPVLGHLTLLVLLDLALIFIFYLVIMRPIYRWLVKNEHI